MYALIQRETISDTRVWSTDEGEHVRPRAWHRFDGLRDTVDPPLGPECMGIVAPQFLAAIHQKNGHEHRVALLDTTEMVS
jgi:hypothetical protein